jgi:Flp pilus assembly pilin Flp
MRRLITNTQLRLNARDSDDGDPNMVKYGLLVGVIAAVVLPGAISSGIDVERLFTIAW